MSPAILLLVSLPIVSYSRIDPNVIPILQKVESRLRSIRTLSADFRSEVQYRPNAKEAAQTRIVRKGQVRLMRPNFAQVDFSLSVRKGSEPWHRLPRWHTETCDGRVVWSVSHSGRDYSSWVADERGTNVSLKLLDPLQGFFDPEAELTKRISLMRSWNDVVRELRFFRRDTIRFSFRPPGTQDIVMEDYRMGRSGIIARIEIHGPGRRRGIFELTNLKIDRPMMSTSFAYEVPPGYRLAKD